METRVWPRLYVAYQTLTQHQGGDTWPNLFFKEKLRMRSQIYDRQKEKHFHPVHTQQKAKESSNFTKETSKFKSLLLLYFSMTQFFIKYKIYIYIQLQKVLPVKRHMLFTFCYLKSCTRSAISWNNKCVFSIFQGVFCVNCKPS